MGVGASKDLECLEVNPVAVERNGGEARPVDALDLLPVEIWERIVKELWKMSPLEAVKVSGTCALFSSLVAFEVLAYVDEIKEMTRRCLQERKDFILDHQRHQLQLEDWRKRMAELCYQMEVLLDERDWNRLVDAMQQAADLRIQYQLQQQNWETRQAEYERKMADWQLQTDLYDKMVASWDCVNRRTPPRNWKCSIV